MSSLHRLFVGYSPPYLYPLGTTQLRWLTGERKLSGQPKVKTKHLSYRVLAEVQAAVARGRQIEALEQERQQVKAEIERLKGWVQGIGQRLQSRLSQNLGVQEGGSDGL